MDYFLFNFSGVQFHYTMSQNYIELDKNKAFYHSWVERLLCLIAYLLLQVHYFTLSASFSLTSFCSSPLSA